MPQVVPFLIKVGTAVAGAAASLGATGVAAAAFGSTAVAAAIGAATVVAAGVALNAAMKGLMPDISMPQVDTDQSRQQTVRGTIEPQKLVYGEALVSGPIFFVGVAGTDNNLLFHAVALTGHEVDDITDIHFDNEVIADAQINALGQVTAGEFGPTSEAPSEHICSIERKTGSDTQVSSSLLTSTFNDWTSSHKARGISYVVTQWKLTDSSQEVWDRLKPNNIKALVKGKKDIYDPRLDVAAGNTAGDNPSTVAYQQWTDNPALCVANYLTDTRFGLSIPASKIDWAAVVTAADACDVTVTVPNSGTEKRFTANGVLFAGDTHRTNINKLLSAMNGSLVYSNGIYTIRAGIYEAPTESLDEDDLAGAVTVKTSVERGDRFNTVRPIFIDPSQRHKSVEAPEVQLTTAVSRDNGEVLIRDIQLPFTNSSFMAQRIAHKQIQLSDQQKVITFPANLTGLRVDVGDRVQVTIEELNYSNKVFRCAGWSFSDTQDGVVNLTLLEDDSGSYADPTAGEYSTISASGIITPGFRGVPDPQNLSATAGLKNIELDWTNPVNTSKFKEIVVFASPNSQWANRVEIGRTMGTQFIHDASNAADPITPGDQRYYWVRAVAYGAGSGSFVESDRNPDNDTSTIFAVCGRVNWSDVSGTTNAPADNATVGGTFGVDIEDGSGNTVTFTTVQNSVLAQEILQVEVESGDVLDLETGLDVDIQNLGDVAIFVSDNSAFLSGRVDAVNTSLTNLESTIVDLTSGVADIFVSPTEPVAGVGGVPDPIPDFSRWYDSDDDNEPYYWTGTAWVSLADPRIAANAASITSLQSSLNTTNSNLSAVQVVADSKIVALFQDSEPSTSGRTTGDLWFDTNDGNKAYRFNGTAWVLARDAGIQTAINNAATAQSTADGKIVTFVQDNPPTASAVGDLWIDSNDNNKLYRWNGSAWVSIRDAGIDANATAISTLDTTVTTLEGEVAVISGSDTTLVSELKKRTKIQDETDDNLETETDEDVETETIDSVTVGLATADQTLQTLVTESREKLASQANDIVALDASIFELETETTANASAVSNLEVRVTSAEGSITSNATDITTLQSDLATTDNTLTGTSTALTALTTRVTANEGSITSQSSDITSLQSSLTSVTDSATANSTAISALDTRVTSAEGTITSQSSDITSLQSDLTTAEGDITTNASAVSALDTRVTSAEGTITSQSSDITSLQSSLTTTNTNVTSNATAITGLDTRVTSAEGSITSQASDITSLQSSLTTANTNINGNATAISGIDTRVTSAEGTITSQASDISTLQAELTTAEGNISGNATAISGIDTRVTSAEGSITSISTDITTLQTSVGDNSTSITTQATSINGLEAQYTVKIDNNGRIAGYGLASTAGDSTPTSEFVVIADKFSVVNPSSTVDNPIIPFQISNNKILMTSDVEVNGNLMVGTISADRIDIDNVTLDTSSGQLIIANGGVDTAQIGTNAVTQVVQDLNSGNQQFSGNSSTRIFRQIADVTLSATGATVQLGGKFMARSHNDQCLCQFRIKRGSTVLFTSQTFSVRPSPEGIHVPIGFIDTAGTTGSVTYTLEAGLNDEFQNYSDAFLFALETKR